MSEGVGECPHLQARQPVKKVLYNMYQSRQAALCEWIKNKAVHIE